MSKRFYPEHPARCPSSFLGPRHLPMIQEAPEAPAPAPMLSDWLVPLKSSHLIFCASLWLLLLVSTLKHILEKASLPLSRVLEKHPSLSRYTVSEWFCGRLWNQEGGRLINDCNLRAEQNHSQNSPDRNKISLRRDLHVPTY